MKKQVIWYLTTPWDRVLWLSEIEQKYILIKKCRFIKDLRKSRKGNVINNCAIFLKWYYRHEGSTMRTNGVLKWLCCFLEEGNGIVLDEDWKRGSWRKREGPAGGLAWRVRGPGGVLDEGGRLGVLNKEWEETGVLDEEGGRGDPWMKMEEEGILGWRERGDLEGSGILAEEWEILVFLDKSLCPIYLLIEQSQAELLD